MWSVGTFFAGVTSKNLKYIFSLFVLPDLAIHIIHKKSQTLSCHVL